MDNEIKQLIIDIMDLEDISVENIDSDAPLFGDGLGLDSIDALELGVALQKKYGIIIKSDDTMMKQHFSSVTALSKFIKNNSQTV